jgi:hypothetical protein
MKSASLHQRALPHQLVAMKLRRNVNTTWIDPKMFVGAPPQRHHLAVWIESQSRMRLPFPSNTWRAEGSAVWQIHRRATSQETDGAGNRRTLCSKLCYQKRRYRRSLLPLFPPLRHRVTCTDQNSAVPEAPTFSLQQPRINFSSPVKQAFLPSRHAHSEDENVYHTRTSLSTANEWHVQPFGGIC